MGKNLPPRPNLDHLRRQAKALLAALAAGDAEAVATMRKHLPAAKGMTADQVRHAPFRLADAQSAVARQTGFGSWPQLARHVEQLRALEGTWTFSYLEVDGAEVPAVMLTSSRLLIDGDRFRTESAEATYEGVFNVDVEAEPPHIDIEFVAGPEAGKWNRGIYRLEEDRLELCLDMTGAGRPAAFRTEPGKGHAYERLTRASRSRPENVTGGTAPVPVPIPDSSAAPDCSAFAYVESATLTRLQGEWAAVRLVRDGQEMPAAMAKSGCRKANRNELWVTFGGQLMIHALIRIDESTDPVAVDYYHLHGSLQGTVQHGILRWQGEDACFNMAAPGQPRPVDLTCSPGSGRVLSQWRLKT